MESTGKQGAAPSAATSLAQGRYVLHSLVGAGGMASVYRVYDARLKVWRAVKVLLPEFARRRKVRERFAFEAHAMARLEHRNILRVYDVGTEGNLPFIVMELAEGGSVAEWVERHGPMPPRMALDVIEGVCAGVSAAHAAKIVHRDLKPQNILLTRDGGCKVTDFGIAHVGGPGNLTRTGAVMGTLGFMAPEQKTNAKDVDARTDVYGIGATLYSMVTGHTTMDLYLAENDPSLLDDVPAPLRDLVQRCTRYRREERFANLDELTAELRARRADLSPVPDTTPALGALAQELGTLLDDPTTVPPPAQSFPDVEVLLGQDFGSVDRPDTLVPNTAANATTSPDLLDDEDDDELDAAPDRQSVVLPYFMPEVDASARSRAEQIETEAPRPSYIDPDQLDDRDDRGGFVIGIKDDDASPAEGEAAEDEDSDATADNSVPMDWQETVEDVLEFAWQMLASAAQTLLRPARFALLPLLLIGALWSVALGKGAIAVKEAQAQADSARTTFFQAVERERLIIDDLAGMGSDRTTLQTLYDDFQGQTQTTPRLEAADRYLNILADDVKRRSLTANALERSKVHMAGKRIERMVQGREAYVDAVIVWEESADTTWGRWAVSLGLADRPD